MKAKTGAAIDRKSGCARNAVIFLAIAVLFRGLGIVQRIGTMDLYSLVTELVLPVTFCLLTILCILTCGKRFLWVSMLPMLTGLLFFIVRVLSADNILGITPGAWEVLLRTLVYLAVSVLYTAAVFSSYRLKWALVPVFGLGIVYHIVFEDYRALFRSEVPLSFSGAMMELSVLFLLLGLLFVALSLRPVGSVVGTQPEKEEKRAFWKHKEKSADGAEREAAQEMAVEPKETESQKAPEEQVPEVKTEKPEENTENKPEDPPTVSPEADPVDSAPDPVAAEEPVSDPKPVFDESFFDRPYRPTLTLDPLSKDNTTETEEK